MTSMSFDSESRFEWRRSAVVSDRLMTVNRQAFELQRAELFEPEFDTTDKLPFNESQAIRLARFVAALTFGQETDIKTPISTLPEQCVGARRLASEESPVFRCLSGGTTGQPSQIRRTQRSWIASFAANTRLFGWGSSERFAVLGDLSHSLALYASLEALHLGARLHLLSGASPRSQIRSLQECKTTVLYCTPSQLDLVAAAADREARSVPSLKTLMIGGSKAAATQFSAARRLFPSAKLVEFYGTTETSFIALGGPEAPRSSVGRPYPDVLLKFASKDRRGNGEILVNSPYLAFGYAAGFEGSAEWKNGFVTTGDIGFQDKEGWLYIVGRKDRRVQVASTSVYPETAEAVISQISGVIHTAVVPVPDRLRGAVLTAFVTVSPNGPPIEAIENHCRGSLRSVECPRRFVAVREWPMLPSGKPNLRLLQLWALETPR